MQVYQFQLHGRSYSVADLLARNTFAGASGVGMPDATGHLPFVQSDVPPPTQASDKFQPRIVWREHSNEPIRRKVFMSETGTYPHDISVTAENGFYIVLPHESVICLSKKPSGVLLLLVTIFMFHPDP